MSEDACIVGENTNDVDEQGGGRPIVGGASRDEWNEASDVEEVKNEGDCEVTLV